MADCVLAGRRLWPVGCGGGPSILCACSRPRPLSASAVAHWSGPARAAAAQSLSQLPLQFSSHQPHVELRMLCLSVLTHARAGRANQQPHPHHDRYGIDSDDERPPSFTPWGKPQQTHPPLLNCQASRPCILICTHNAFQLSCAYFHVTSTPSRPGRSGRDTWQC